MKCRVRIITSILLVAIIVISSFVLVPFTVSAAGTANDIVNVAQGEVGVSGQPNKYTYWLGSINGSYSYAWCHAFVSWCANQAGVSDKVPRTASCATGVNWFKNRGEWKSRSSGYTPKAGDIIYFDWGANGTYDHVGIVTSSGSGRVYTIEGNARNAVKVNGGYSNGYSLTSTDILGYGVPSYSNSNFPGEEDTSYNVPVWKTANSKLDTYDSNGNKESGRWIDAGDNCYIEKVYKNGYAWVKYPTSNGDRWAYTNASGFSLDRNPPTNVYLDKNQYWYDIQDTITLYPHADNATSYWLSVYKGDNHIVDTSVDGEYSFSASQWGYGDYYAWITASNSVGGTDSERISFTVCGVPSYSDIWTSKGFYDWDENEQIKINVSTVCAKGQCIGIDFLDNNLNYVKRIITENCDTTFTVSAKTLGIGYFSAYFSVFNGSGGIDTKKVYFYIGQKKDLGAEFCAKIKNQSLNRYLTAVGNNVEGKDENCDKQQVWFFYRLSDGSYKIKNYYDWRSMDVHNYADAGAGTNVQVYEDWDSDAQRFYIYEICGAYYIKPVCTDMVLDMSQSTYNLEVWGAGFNWTPQKFDIEKIEESDIGVHKYTEKVVPPTKDNNGYTEHICSICGHSYKDTYTYIGDINADGNINILDATMIQKHSAELELLDDNLCKYADVNGDGKADIIDATLIQKYSAELITQF